MNQTDRQPHQTTEVPNGAVSNTVPQTAHNKAEVNPILAAALDYATQGLQVLPLIGKAPLVKNGLHDASSDPDLIRAWWHRWPWANVGIRVPKCCVVLDIDPRHDGSNWKLETLLGQLPTTLTCATGGGGLHLWYLYPGQDSGEELHQGILNKSGIDLRASKSYVVSPPSVHPDTHQPYQWANDAAMAPLPAAATRLLLKPTPRPVRRSTGNLASPKRWQGLIDKVATAHKGNRNSILYWALCRAVENNAPAEVIEQLHQAALQAAPEEAGKIAATFRSAIKGHYDANV